MYSFTDGFSSYHQVRIEKEDQHKMTFVTEWGCYPYTIMPFGLKNAPAIFSKIVFSSFKYFIHKFLEVYFDYWILFGLTKDHIESLKMMVEHCLQYQISLNLKKCISCDAFGVRLGHVVYRDGILVNHPKIVIIFDLPPPTTIKELIETLRHTRYYNYFIKGYV